MMNIRKELTVRSKPKPDASDLGFGRHFSDHMFVMDYAEGAGWHDARIVPYAPLSLDPAAMVFHYGQAAFEGMKAYRGVDGRILLFRPDLNARRFHASNERMGIPPIDERRFIEAVSELVRTDADWIPASEGGSLYIRPFVIATEAGLGVRPAAQYSFVVIMSPVGAYYEEGLKPVDIYVEDDYVRAVRGGTGSAKTPVNYAPGLKAQQEAKKHGCSQVLWLDAIHRTYVEEVGSMNVFFKAGGEVWTPRLNGSILEGVTRRSVMQLLDRWGVPVKERDIGIEELLAAADDGTLEEAFGTGTAAVVAPIGGLYRSRKHPIRDGSVGPLSRRLHETIVSIQRGREADSFGWTSEI